MFVCDVFAAFRVGWDMFDIPHGGVVGTWSGDDGNTWDEPLPLIFEPGWDWFGAQRMLQLSDGNLLMLLGKARWNTDLFFTFSTRSGDGGRTWEEIGLDIKMFNIGSEPYGQGIAGEPAAGRLMLAFQGADEENTPARVGVAFSSDEGRTWSELVIIASESGLSFREADFNFNLLLSLFQHFLTVSSIVQTPVPFPVSVQPESIPCF